MISNTSNREEVLEAEVKALRDELERLQRVHAENLDNWLSLCRSCGQQVLPRSCPECGYELGGGDGI